MAMETSETTYLDFKGSRLESRCVAMVVAERSQSSWLSTIGTTLRCGDSLLAFAFTVFLD